MKITVTNKNAGRSYQRYLIDGQIRRHSNLWNELDLEQPKNNSNLYIGIAMGVMIVLCGVIYLVGSLMG